MGLYLEVKNRFDKAMQLKRDHGAQVVNKPKLLSDIPRNKTLVCVVENGTFDAIGVCFNQAELEAFAFPDRRRKTWMLIDTVEVIKMHPNYIKYLREDGTWNFL